MDESGDQARNVSGHMDQETVLGNRWAFPPAEWPDQRGHLLAEATQQPRQKNTSVSLRNSQNDKCLQTQSVSGKLLV